MVSGDIQQKNEVQTFVHKWGEPFPVANPNPLIKNTLGSVLFLITVIILKRVREREREREREYFISK